MTLSIGIDIGGTKIAAALVDLETGRVVRRLRDATPDNAAAVLDRCRAMAQELGAAGGQPVGLAICELVDHRGNIASAATIALRTGDFEAAFRDIGPLRVESDVRAAAVAEARYGAAVGADVALVISAGTGLSHTLLVRGQPFLGAHGHAILIGAPPTQDVAGGAAIASRARAAGLDPYGDTAEMERIRTEAGTALGVAAAGLVNALDPSVVVFGGGLSLVDTYTASAIAATRRSAETIPGVERAIVVSPLGADASVLGAAVIAAEAPASTP